MKSMIIGLFVLGAMGEALAYPRDPRAYNGRDERRYGRRYHRDEPRPYRGGVYVFVDIFDATTIAFLSTILTDDVNKEAQILRDEVGAYAINGEMGALLESRVTQLMNLEPNLSESDAVYVIDTTINN